MPRSIGDEAEQTDLAQGRDRLDRQEGDGYAFKMKRVHKQVDGPQT